MNQETNSKTHKKGSSQPMLRPSSTEPVFTTLNNPPTEEFACVVDDSRSTIVNGNKQLGKSGIKLAQISIASKTRSKSKPKRSSTMVEIGGVKNSSPITVSGPLSNHYSSSPETNELSSNNTQSSLTPTSASKTPQTPYYENPSTFEYPNTSAIKHSNKQRKSRTNSNPHAYKNRKISKDISILKNPAMQTGSIIDAEELSNTNNGLISNEESNYAYQHTLGKFGYSEIRVISPSLQGTIVEAAFSEQSKSGFDTVIIKVTNKRLHELKRSNKNGKTFRVYENVIKEKGLLMYLTMNTPPKALVCFEQFFEDEFNYFLVMEHGGEDFFDWIVQCHKWIRDHKLTLKQWNQYLRDLMMQITELILWLHTRMHVCHLDVSLENMLIKNNKWKYDKSGGIRLSRRMQVKFCDFGLAEYFENSDFTSTKYVGKTHYKAPKVYAKKETFDARAADIWSFGVSFFMMLIGAPPYKLPTDNDDHFPYVKKNNVLGILQKWNREHYLNKYTLDLLNIMLCYQEHLRANIEQIYNHEWFKGCRKHTARESPWAGNTFASNITSNGRKFKSKNKSLKKKRSNSVKNPTQRFAIFSNKRGKNVNENEVNADVNQNFPTVNPVSFQDLVNGEIESKKFGYRTRTDSNS